MVVHIRALVARLGQHDIGGHLLHPPSLALSSRMSDGPAASISQRLCNGQDERVTTLMVRNLPEMVSQQEVVEETRSGLCCPCCVRVSFRYEVRR